MIKLEEKEGSEASDSKEKVGLGRTSDHPGGEKYSPKVSFVLHSPGSVELSRSSAGSD